ncbi:MAG: hypothetical protein GC190_21215 [Alphaproteobacteria bacterium]|nr:hypothetical protein [Alphaproteobacteria bacterium]
MLRAQWLGYLMQPGVIMAGLIGTFMQVALGVANNFNIAGLGDLITHYGLSAHLASGGLVAALTGLFYSLTERVSGHTVATGSGAAAGGVSGTLGLALSQTLGITPVAAGATPIINFAMLPALVASLMGYVEPTAASAAAHTAAAAPAAFDTTALAQVFTMTAAGGGAGAFVGRLFTGHQTRRATRKSQRPHHAHS